MENHRESTTAGNRWFVAAAVLGLVLAGVFGWASFKLQGVLDREPDSVDQVLGVRNATALLPDAAQAVISREHEQTASIRHVLRSGVRLAYSGFLLVFLFVVVGYVTRVRAVRSGAGHSSTPPTSQTGDP